MKRSTEHSGSLGHSAIMSHDASRRTLLKGSIGALTIGIGGLGALSPALAHTQDDASTGNLFRVGGGQAASWVRNLNPLVPDSLRPAQYGIYEPLFIYSTTNGEFSPWLASEWSYNDDGSVLTFTLREGVTWSDGEAFDAEDVAFTFNLLRDNSALSGSSGVRAALDYVESFEATDPTTVTVTFSQPFSPALYAIGQQAIVPQHIWSTIDDPVTFANEDPVGTGPFTEIGVFRPQYWELLKNPNYWQAGLPKIEGLAYPSYGSNDAGTLGLINDDFDWMGMFVPDVEDSFVAQDPEHLAYWFPAVSGVVGLFFNTTKAPFDNADVRKAISMGINREQVCTVAMYDYTGPADATGMSDLYAKYKSEEVAEAGKDLVSLNVDRANQMLDELGFSRSGDTRTTPDGTPMEYDLVMPSGWSDWMQVAQVLSQNLKEIGVTVNPKGLESTTWYDATYKGEFDLSLGNSGSSPTPFDHFRNLMSAAAVAPVGQVSTTNWIRFGDEETDVLLSEFAATPDEATQIEIAHQLQQRFLDLWPVAPIFPSPSWGQSSSRHFTGYPSADNPYATPGPAVTPGFLLVTTTVEPVAE